MRIVTTKHQVAKFDEFSKEGQRKILDKQYDINVDHDWSEELIAEYKEDLKILGFSNIEINYSGFSCQGDGASFTGSYSIPTKREAKARLEKFKEQCGIEKFVKLAEELSEHKFSKDDEESVKVYRLSSRYYHENTVKSDCDFIDEWSKDYMRAIYRSLRDQHNYLTSDEAIKETIECNEYEFNTSTFEIEK